MNIYIKYKIVVTEKDSQIPQSTIQLLQSSRLQTNTTTTPYTGRQTRHWDFNFDSSTLFK